MGCSIGLNGCSLKTKENLSVIENCIPVDRILLETDCPWCEIRPTHASYEFVKTKFESVKKGKWCSEKLVQGRNEPCQLIQVAEVISHIKQMDIEDFIETVHANTCRVFPALERASFEE
ncbi:hypothetical protein ACOME3_002825 [Neoechinorhynchus agilis]